MLYYLQKEPFLTNFYLERMRENSWSMKNPGFFKQYRLMQYFIRKTFPFNLVKKGDTVVQTGAAAWTFDSGISQVAMLSVLVGNRGKVIVIEPDIENVNYLKLYLSKYRIKNIEIFQTGVWSSESSTVLFKNNSSTGAHVLREVLLEKGKSPVGYNKVPLQVTTVDKLMDKLGIQPDFVNITVNGGEFEVLKGMQECLKRGTAVAYPIFGPREWYQDSFNLLKKYSYSVLIADAPPTLRGTANNPNRSLKSRSKFPQRLSVLSTNSSHPVFKGKKAVVQIKKTEEAYILNCKHSIPLSPRSKENTSEKGILS